MEEIRWKKYLTFNCKKKICFLITQENIEFDTWDIRPFLVTFLVTYFQYTISSFLLALLFKMWYTPNFYREDSSGNVYNSLLLPFWLTEHIEFIHFWLNYIIESNYSVKSKESYLWYTVNLLWHLTIASFQILFMKSCPGRTHCID